MMSKDRSSPAAEEEPQVEEAEAQEEPAREPTALELSVARGVEAWYASCVRDTVIARDTPAYNHLQSVVPELSKFIGKELNDE
jgi:hypothetical protein